MKRVAIIGRTKAMLETGQRLVEKGYEVPLVITSKEAPEYNITAADFEAFARSIGAVFVNSPTLEKTQIRLMMSAMEPIDIACSINYSGVISDETIRLFKYGILNAHAGDLPRYRGNAVIAWAIINGEERIALCIHRMIGGELDSGPIISRVYHQLDLQSTIGSLYDWVYSATPSLFLESIESLRKDPNYVLEYQSTDPLKALRCYPRLPEDGRVDWKMDAIAIMRLINASGKPFYGSFTFLNEMEVIIEDAELFEDGENYVGIPGQIVKIISDGSVLVLTGSGKIRLKRIRVAGANKNISPSEIVKSVRKRFR